MKRLSAVILVLLVVGSLWGAEIKVPEKVTVKAGRLTQLEATCESKFALKWINLFEDLDCLSFEQGRSVVLGSTKPGVYKVAVYTGDEKGPSSPVYIVVVVESPPTPPGPVPPGPIPPGPVPPGPVTGLRVLILYESADLTKMPAGQQSVLYAKSVRDYLNSKCIVGTDGKTKEWGIYDADSDLSSLSKQFQEMKARPRTAVPWMVISGDKGIAFEGPLPISVDAALEILKKHGG